MIKKILLGIGVIVLMLWLTNPSLTDFRNYCSVVNETPTRYLLVGRTNYFLIFSNYECKFHYGDKIKVQKFRGFFNSFYFIDGDYPKALSK